MADDPVGPFPGEAGPWPFPRAIVRRLFEASREYMTYQTNDWAG